MKDITVNDLKPGDMFRNNEYYRDFYIKIVHKLSIKNSGHIYVQFEYIDINGHVHYNHQTYNREVIVTKISI